MTRVGAEVGRLGIHKRTRASRVVPPYAAFDTLRRVA